MLDLELTKHEHWLKQNGRQCEISCAEIERPELLVVVRLQNNGEIFRYFHLETLYKLGVTKPHSEIPIPFFETLLADSARKLLHERARKYLPVAELDALQSVQSKLEKQLEVYETRLYYTGQFVWQAQRLVKNHRRHVHILSRAVNQCQNLHWALTWLGKMKNKASHPKCGQNFALVLEILRAAPLPLFQDLHLFLQRLCLTPFSIAQRNRLRELKRQFKEMANRYALEQLEQREAGESDEESEEGESREAMSVLRPALPNPVLDAPSLKEMMLQQSLISTRSLPHSDLTLEEVAELPPRFR